jgi:hypothetical protein
MRTFLVALLILSFQLCGFSQFIPTSPDVKFFVNGQPTRIGADAAMFADVSTRVKIDLDGAWRYSADGQTWSSVAIPSAYDFSGKVTFQRTFEMKPEMIDRYTFSLVAYGINYQAEITINGNFVGRHTGGYTSFIIPIPDNTIQVGSENSITINVDNELTTKTTVPLNKQVGRSRTYGGIVRDIYLIATPKLYVEHVITTTHPAADFKSAKIIVRGEITDRWSGLSSDAKGVLGFQVEVIDKLTGDLVGRSGISPINPLQNKTVVSTAEVALQSPKLWSPEAPDLYVLKCQIVRIVGKDVTLLDEYDTEVGIREILWKDGKVVLNNVPISLKGILWQEDHPTYASAMTYDAMERDVASIKTLGVNAIRFLAPPPPYMVNLCDKYGLFVLEDIPIIDVPAEILSKDYYQDIVTNYAKEMVERDRNHASVLAWGIGDEFQVNTEAACEFINGIRNIIKSMDKRNVYFSTRSMNTSCFEYVDMIAVNSYGDDPKVFRSLLQECRMRYPDKPMIVARYGYDVEPGNHNGYSNPLSMESQARYIMQFFTMVQDLKISGSILWSYNDWRTDRPSLSTHSRDPYLNTMGIVGYDREKRTAFDVVRSLMNDEKVQALPVGNYSSNAPIVFVIAGFIVLISFAFMYNANRRFRDAVNRSLLRTYNFFADVRDQRILTYMHSSILALVLAITWATVVSSILMYYRSNHLLDNLLSQVLSDRMKEWLIQFAWNPIQCIAILSGIILLKFLLISVLVKLFSMMVRTRVYYYHAYSITIWSMLPFILLIPLSMILFRLLDAQFYIIPIFILIGILILWVLFRLFKGISIIYDIYPVKVYAVGFLFIIVVCLAIYGYLDYTHSTTLYFKYLLETAG